MGGQLARDIDSWDMDLEQKVALHFQANHFPAIHPDFIPTALKAIELAQQAIDEDDDRNWSVELTMPNGKVRTVSQLIERMHLKWFLNNKEECNGFVNK